MVAGTEDQSCEEIRTLLKALNNRRTSSKEKLRRLKAFRTYLEPDKSNSTPLFYDDDIRELFLDDADEDETASGLLRICSERSRQNRHQLTKVALDTLQLIHFLLVEFEDLDGGENEITDEGFKSMFADFISFSASRKHVKAMDLDVHLNTVVDKSKKDNAQHKKRTCEVVAFFITKHAVLIEEEYEDIIQKDYMKLEDILITSDARLYFLKWVKNQSKEIQEEVNTALSTAVMHVNAEASTTLDAASITGGSIHPSSAVRKGAHPSSSADGNLISQGAGVSSSSVSAAMMLPTSIGQHKNEPTTWIESEMYDRRETERERQRKARDRKEAYDEAKKAEAAEARRLLELMRDPLNIHIDPSFDLRNIDNSKTSISREMLERLKSEQLSLEQRNNASYSKEDSNASVITYEARKRALDAVPNIKVRMHDSTNTDLYADVDPSVKLTDANFDPLYFLTYAHGNTSLQDLKTGLTNIQNRKNDQLSKQRHSVTEHIDLFARCSNGIDIFGRLEDSSSSNEFIPPSLSECIEKLTMLTDESVSKAKHSFKPLLDNTDDIRKYNASLQILQRVRPYVEIPLQMKHCIDAGRYSAAIRAYRRVLTIPDNYKIQILASAKVRAYQQAKLARARLERIIADPSSSVRALIDGITDLMNLIKLEVTSSQTGDIAGECVSFSTIPSVLQAQPSVACLHMQAMHFERAVHKAVFDCKEKYLQIARERTQHELLQKTFESAGEAFSIMARSASSSSANAAAEEEEEEFDVDRWRRKIHAARVFGVRTMTKLARHWLPRLIQLAVKGREIEIFRSMSKENLGERVFRTFNDDVPPPLLLLVQFSSFCALGRASTRSIRITSSKGSLLDDLLTSETSHEDFFRELECELPDFMMKECAQENVVLDEEMQKLHQIRAILTGDEIQRPQNPNGFTVATNWSKSCTMEAEERVCQNVFRTAKRECRRFASSSGELKVARIRKMVVDEFSTLRNPQYVQHLIRRNTELLLHDMCCDLDAYIESRDYADEAILQVIAECAKSLAVDIPDLVREMVDLFSLNVVSEEDGNDGGQETAILSDSFCGELQEREEYYFDCYIASIRKKMRSCVRAVVWERTENVNLEDYAYSNYEQRRREAEAEEEKFLIHSDDYDDLDNLIMDHGRKKNNYISNLVFPGYLSSVLLGIVRCKAQCFKTMGVMQRKVKSGQQQTYQIIAVQTASQECLSGLCAEINEKKKFLARTASSTSLIKLATEIQFLIRILEPYLTNEVKNKGYDCQTELIAYAIDKNVDADSTSKTYESEVLVKKGEVYVLALALDAASTEL